jgi:hypothetical protein
LGIQCAYRDAIGAGGIAQDCREDLGGISWIPERCGKGIKAIGDGGSVGQLDLIKILAWIGDGDLVFQKTIVV